MQREDVERLAHRLDRAMLYLPDGDTTAMGEEAAAALRALLGERDAAFAAGQEEMRERAAEQCDCALMDWEGDVLHDRAKAIRALPIKDGPDGR